MSIPAIATSGLRKTFGPTVALDGLDFTVAEGEVHGFLGPNGAGKSTTLRILLGLIRSSGGSASVFGQDPWTDAVALHRRLAYVPGDVTLWPNLTGGEAIDLLGTLRGGISATRRSELIDAFELDPRKKGRSYSKGNRQKVALVAALASDAELLLLDEPTAGLDPLMERVFQDELVRVRDQGRTVLLSSHILSEVEKACSVLSIVRAGRIVETGTLTGLRHLSHTHVVATFADGRVEESSLPPAEVAPWIAGLGAGIVNLTATPPTLEDIFLSQYSMAGANGRGDREGARDHRAGDHRAGDHRAGGPPELNEDDRA